MQLKSQDNEPTERSSGRLTPKTPSRALVINGTDLPILETFHTDTTLDKLIKSTSIPVSIIKYDHGSLSILTPHQQDPQSCRSTTVNSYKRQGPFLFKPNYTTIMSPKGE